MTKFNKVALAVLALGVTSVACAGMYEPPPGMMDDTSSLKKSLYAGIGIGGIGFESDVSTQGSVTVNGVEARSVSSSADAGNYGLNSYLLIGYALTFPNKVFLGTEVFGNYTNVPVTINNSSTSSDANSGTSTTGDANVNMTLKGDYGIRVLPGYQITPSSTVYGIVGYSRAYTSTSTTNNLVSTHSGTETGYNLSSSDNFWFNGLQLGLGSMIKVTDHVSLRGDMIWTGYQSQTLASKTTSDANGSGLSSITAQPTTIEADVGLVYMFD